MMEGEPEGVVLWFIPSCADTEDQSSAAHLVQGRRHLCKNRRMSEGVARHQSADLHSTGRLGQRRQHGPALPDSSGRLTGITVEEMVRKPDTIETIRLSLPRDCSDRIIRAPRIVLALVRQKDHQPNPQRLLPEALSRKVGYFWPVKSE